MKDPMKEEKDKPDVEKLFELWQAAQDYQEALLERNQLIRECLERGIAVSRISESAGDRKSTRLNSSHTSKSRMPSSA